METFPLRREFIVLILLIIEREDPITCPVSSLFSPVSKIRSCRLRLLSSLFPLSQVQNIHPQIVDLSQSIQSAHHLLVSLLHLQFNLLNLSFFFSSSLHSIYLFVIRTLPIDGIIPSSFHLSQCFVLVFFSLLLSPIIPLTH